MISVSFFVALDYNVVDSEESYHTMYQEMTSGWIELITGPMFAGKSQELIRRLTTLLYANKKIIAFKPSIDNRYDASKIATHNGGKYEAHAIDSIDKIWNFVKDDAEVVAVDEVQFFGKDAIDIFERLANSGKRVIAAGLDMDFRGESFGIMPDLMARAEFVTKLEAACTICGKAATRSQRLIDGKPAFYEDPLIVVGAKEEYEARCRKHHYVPHRDGGQNI